ncbi:MAG: hypothetical protein M1821_008024 [Bathelium mastoideum]|nr:MAG: hypothetical protein M1821_008024 [Bathelium mastoideum]
MGHEQLEHLLQVLAERRIHLEREDVQWAFESSKTEQHASAWVEEYLHAPTLLSHEELELYESIPKHIKKEFRNTVGQEAARPFTDGEVQRALESIESSTASIEAHIEQLQIQKEALLQLTAQNESVNTSVIVRKEALFKKQEKEKYQLNTLVEELSDDLRFQTAAAEKEAQVAIDSVTPFINDTFQADDRLLTGLSNLLPKLGPSLNNQDLCEHVDQWCRAIVSFRTAEVNSQIEALYRQAHGGQHGQTLDDPQQELQKEQQTLEAELNSLKAEIIHVLSMVINHEFRQPIIETIRGRSEANMKSRKDWLSYIHASLYYMKTRLNAIETYAQDARAYNQTLKEFQDFLIEELSQCAPEKISGHDRKRKSRDLRALVNPQTGLREFLLGKGAPQKEDPAERLLRHFDVQPSGSRTEDTCVALDKAISERQQRLQEHYESTDRSMAKSLAEVFGSADTDLQDLLGSLYGYTAFNNVRLSDVSSEERINGLENAINDAVKQLGNLDIVDSVDLERKKEAIIAKWS